MTDQERDPSTEPDADDASHQAAIARERADRLRSGKTADAAR